MVLNFAQAQFAFSMTELRANHFEIGDNISIILSKPSVILRRTEKKGHTISIVIERKHYHEFAILLAKLVKNCAYFTNIGENFFVLTNSELTVSCNFPCKETFTVKKPSNIITVLGEYLQKKSRI